MDNNQCIALSESWNIDGEEYIVQYDNGAQVCVVGADTMERLPESVYELGEKRVVTTGAWSEDLSQVIEVQDVVIAHGGHEFPCLIVPSKLEGLEMISVEAPEQWVELFDHGRYNVGGKLDFLLGSRWEG